MALDNLLEADVVLADGCFVTTNAKENADLFWEIRGGGGNFGIVTSFLFRGCPVDQVFAGPVLWEMEHARELLEWYPEAGPAQPEEMYGFFALLKVPPGPPFPEELYRKTMCGMLWPYSGPLDKVEDAFRPVRKFRAPKFELTGLMAFTALQSMFDAIYPPGLQWYLRGDFLAQIPDKAIDEHLKFGEQLPTFTYSPFNHAPLPGGRRRRPSLPSRNCFQLSQREVADGDGRSRRRERRKDYDLDQRLLGGTASLQSGRRPRELYDGRRNRSDQGDLPG